jgi:hypothetical protein
MKNNPYDTTGQNGAVMFEFASAASGSTSIVINWSSAVANFIRGMMLEVSGIDGFDTSTAQLQGVV